ncbi:MAG TPA: transferase, partial [Bradyrhizobium sp.]
MRQIVIFGTGEMAELADFYFANDSAYEVAGFAVDAAFRKQDEFRGRPVAAFEEAVARFPPDRYGMFV